MKPHRVCAHCVKLLTQLLGCYTYPSCLCQLCEAVGTALGILHLPIVSFPIMSLPIVLSFRHSSWDITLTHPVFAHHVCARCVKLLKQLLGCYTYPSCLCPFCKYVQTALGILPSCLCPLCEAVDTVLGMSHLPIASLPIV